MTADAPHVLVIRRRYLGDIVLLGSVFRNLRLHWPNAEITALTEAPYAGVLPLNPDVNATLTFPRRLTEWPAILRVLRRARFTHVLDFDNTEKTAALTRLTGALLRVAFDRELIKFRWRRCYTHTAKVANAFYDSHHITETYLQLLQPIGVRVATREVRLVPRPADLEAARKIVPRGGKKILLHPGSRSPHRVWPPERFAAVGDRLQDELGAQVFLVAGPAEQPLVQQIRAHAKSHLVAVDRSLSVGEFAALAAQFDVFLCHDSGPMHVAAAVGTPVVALFGSQNATIWRPLGDRHTVLQTPRPCACIGAAAPTPCVKDDAYRSYCVRMLTEPQVFAAVAAQLTSGKR
jgi:heptosyltransferase III